jgi:hypothetical protein
MAEFDGLASGSAGISPRGVVAEDTEEHLGLASHFSAPSPTTGEIPLWLSADSKRPVPRLRYGP